MQRSRFYVETTIALIAGVLGVVTLFWPDWLEVTGWDPDHHNGSMEWFVVVGLAVAAAAAGMTARREWLRRLTAQE